MDAMIPIPMSWCSGEDVRIACVAADTGLSRVEIVGALAHLIASQSATPCGSVPQAYGDSLASVPGLCDALVRHRLATRRTTGIQIPRISGSFWFASRQSLRPTRTASAPERPVPSPSGRTVNPREDGTADAGGLSARRRSARGTALEGVNLPVQGELSLEPEYSKANSGPKKSPTPPCFILLLSSSNSFGSVWSKWEEHRKQKGKWTEGSKRAQIEKANKIASEHGVEALIACINRAIECGWSSFFPESNTAGKPPEAKPKPRLAKGAW